MLLPGLFGYCDVEMAEALHSRHLFVLGTRSAKKAVHARYPADAIIGPCQVPVCLLYLGYPYPCNWPVRQYKNQNLPVAGLVSDSNSSPSDVCMPQNAHLPYYLVWASTKYRA